MNTTVVIPVRITYYLLVFVIASSLGLDYLAYGTVYPLTMFSPAGITRNEELSMLGGCFALGAVISTTLFIFKSERLGSRRPMIAGAIILGMATGLIALAPNLPVMAIGRVAQGIASGATWTAGLAIIAKNYSSRRVEMMGYAFMGSTAGSVGGPMLAGWLYDVGGYRLPFIVVLGLIGINLIFLLALLPDETNSPIVVPDFRTLVFNPAVLAPSFAVLLAAAAVGILEPIGPLLLGSGGANPKGMGIILACATMVYGLCSPFVSHMVQKFGSTRTMYIGILGLALTLPLTGLASGVLQVGTAMCVFNVMYAITLNPASAAMGDAIDARGLKCYTAVYAIYNLIYSIGQVGASALATVVLSYITLPVGLFVFGALILLSILVMFKLSRLNTK